MRGNTLFLSYSKTDFLNQGSFISEMKCAPFKCLFWNGYGLVVKLMVSIKSTVSLWYRPFYKNMLNYGNDHKCQKITAI